MKPQNIPKGIDGLNAGSKSPVLGAITDTRHQITGLAMSLVLATGLAGCKPQDANAQTTGQESQVVRVAENNAVPLDTVITLGETGSSAEILSEEVIFSKVEGIVRDTMEGREQQKWLYFVEKFKTDSIVGVNEESFIDFALANDSQILNLLSSIPNLREDFPNLDNLVAKAENQVARDENQVARDENQVAAAALEFVEGVEKKIN